MIKNKLDFVAVGPFKTGTSWIYDYLSDYDRVALPTKVKETFFFDCKFDRGIDWYFSHFDESELEKGKIGEIAPSYFHSVEASQRIYDHNPQCKIIVTLREPIARLVSFYQHMQQRGEITPKTTFIEAVSKRKILLETARYHHHLSRWIDLFGQENVKVILFEDLKKDPIIFAQKLCHELNIEIENESRDLSKKVNASYRPINHNLSKIVYSGVNLLHNIGLHKVVDYGKNMGIKNILFSSKSKKTELSNADKNTAFNLIEDDILMLEDTANLDISSWKSAWQEYGLESEFIAANNYQK